MYIPMVVAVLFAATVGLGVYIAVQNRTRRSIEASRLELARYQTDAARLPEVKKLLADRDTQLNTLQASITQLAAEKATAVALAEAADRRAAELLQTERATQEQILRAKDKEIEGLNEFINQARSVLSMEFKVLSADVLNNASSQLVRAANELIKTHGEATTAEVRMREQHIEMMLKPVEETINRLDQHIETSSLARTKAEALLDGQINRLAKASESLTNALRKPVVRGSWGEMTLENALENAGLQEQVDYVLQHSTDAEDGRKRTDAIVNLPKGRKLIIDSKNLMESFIAIATAQNETQKLGFIEAHSKALRNHVKSLSAKEYWRRYDGLDCVILFIPHDGMYHAAIQDEAELIRDASEKRVFIANPMTLIPLLKAIRYVLDQERLNKSAEEISRVGAELYGELARFAENISKVGERLKDTVKAYNDAVPGIERYIVAKSRKLKQLGSGKGPEAELPDFLDIEPRPFTAPELRDGNVLDPELSQDNPEENLAIARGANTP